MKTLRGKIVLGSTLVILVSYIGINMLVAQVLKKNLETNIVADLEKIKDVTWSKLENISSISPLLSDISKNYDTYISIEGEESYFAGKIISRMHKEDILRASHKRSVVAYIGDMEGVYGASYGYPIYEDGVYKGTLIIQKEYTGLKNNDKSMLKNIIWGEIIVFLIMMIALYIWLSKVTKHLKILHQGLISLEQGNFGEKLPEQGNDEIAKLSRAFNGMQTKIDEQMNSVIAAKKKSEALEKETKNFFNYATHEIKTPLTAIKGYSQLLEDETLEKEDIQRMGKRIGIESERMYKLIEHMLMVAKGRQIEGKKEWFNLRELIEETIELNECVRHRTGKKIETQLMDAKIYGNKEEVSTIAKNLIDNAIKYSADEHINIHMEISDTIKVIYRNAIGQLPEDIKDMLLQPFVKYHYGEKSKVSSGLGLFICQELMSKNKGVITYEIQDEAISFTLNFKKQYIEESR